MSIRRNECEGDDNSGKALSGEVSEGPAHSGGSFDVDGAIGRIDSMPDSMFDSIGEIDHTDSIDLGELIESIIFFDKNRSDESIESNRISSIESIKPIR